MLENRLEFKDKDERSGSDSSNIQEQDEVSQDEAEEQTDHDMDVTIFRRYK